MLRLKSAILLFLIPFTLYLIPAMLPAAFAANVTLAWEANSEPDLEGYVVYRKTGSPGPPYGYSSDLPEDELTDPLHPRVTLTGLSEDKEYYIALTAYDTDGNESRYSNDVCVEVVNGITQLCSAGSGPGSSPVSSSGGGSGGGCFISSSQIDSSTFSELIARPVIRSQVLAMVFLLLVLIAAVKFGLNKLMKNKKDS